MACRGSETEQITALVIEWGRRRWPGCRVIRELVCGDRRVDLVFVCERDLVGFEIKAGTDRLDRLADQVKEYGRFIPEIWVAIAPRWQDDRRMIYFRPNLLVVDVSAPPAEAVTCYLKDRRARRDELVTARMLEWLWHAEAARIAQRTDVIPGPIHKQFRTPHIKKLLARLLTGNEIIAEVCRELRSRPLVGRGSDPPVGDTATAAVIGSSPRNARRTTT